LTVVTNFPPPNFCVSSFRPFGLLCVLPPPQIHPTNNSPLLCNGYLQLNIFDPTKLQPLFFAPSTFEVPGQTLLHQPFVHCPQSGLNIIIRCFFLPFSLAPHCTVIYLFCFVWPGEKTCLGRVLGNFVFYRSSMTDFSHLLGFRFAVLELKLPWFFFLP